MAAEVHLCRSASKDRHPQDQNRVFFSDAAHQNWSSWRPVYFIIASSLRFTSSQFTIFQKASTNFPRSFL